MRHVYRSFRILLLISGLLLVMTLGVMAWLLRTESGLKTLIHVVSQESNKRGQMQLTVNGVNGNAWQGFSLRQLQVKDDKKVVLAAHVFVQLDWFKLLDSKVLFQNMSAKRIEIKQLAATKTEQEKMSLPSSIQLPVQIGMPKVSIDQLVFNQQTVNNIRLSASTSNSQLLVDSFVVNFQQIEGHLQGKLNLSQPYAIDMKLNTNGFIPNEALQFTGVINLSGNLNRLVADTQFEGSRIAQPEVTQSFSAEAIITAFQPTMLQSLSVRAQNLNPQQWFAQAPAGQFNLNLAVNPNEDFTQSRGQIVLNNAAPVRVAAGGVPFSELVADYELKLKGNKLVQVDLSIKKLLLQAQQQQAGLVKGNATWRPNTSADENIFLKVGNAEFDLQFQNLNLAVFINSKKSHKINASIKGQKKAGQVVLSRFKIEDGASRIDGRANLNLVERNKSHIRFEFANIDPERYVPKDWKGNAKGILNGQFSFAGYLPQEGKLLSSSGKVVAGFYDSTLQNKPFDLNVQAEGKWSRITHLNLNLEVADNTLNVQGAYGFPQDAMTWQLKADNLKGLGTLFDQNIDGTLALYGQASGPFGATDISVDFKAGSLRYQDTLEMEVLEGNAKLGLYRDAPIQGQLNIRNIEKPNGDTLLSSMQATLSGSMREHLIGLSFSNQKELFLGQQPSGDFKFRGGVNVMPQAEHDAIWEGSLIEAKLQGLWKPVTQLKLTQPVALKISASGLRIEEFSLKGDDGSEFVNEQIVIEPEMISVKGSASRLSLPKLSSLVNRPVTIETDRLVVQANWQFESTPGDLKGRFNLKHQSGGFSILEDEEIKVPVESIQARGVFDKKAIALEVDLNLKETGVINASLALPVMQNVETMRWQVDETAPIEGAVAAGMTNLGWLGPLLNPALRTTGDGQVALVVSGSLKQPNLQGRVFARQLNVTDLNKGVRLEEGNVVIDFNNDRALIEDFQFTVYHRQVPSGRLQELGPLIQGVGTVKATGQWNLNGIGGQINLDVQKAPIIQQAEQWVLINSKLELKQPKQSGNALVLSGNVDALGAYFELPDQAPPQLSSDVVIKGKEKKKQEALPFTVDLTVNMGPAVYLNVEGLKTRLTGSLDLAMSSESGNSVGAGVVQGLRAKGTIQTVDGVYRAYGQDLTIERGVVNFQGSLANPGLNIRAVRKGVAVEAGVEVTGRVNKPVINLVSDPPVPDSEKLSWMIVGRGTNGSGDRDAGLLLTAATSLFADPSSESTTEKVADAFGLDDLTLSSGSLTAADSQARGSRVAISPGADASATVLNEEDPLLTQRIIMLGKRINQAFYLTFEQSVTTSANVIKLTYQYSRNLSFIARGGADTAIDALYQFSFD